MLTTTTKTQIHPYPSPLGPSAGSIRREPGAARAAAVAIPAVGVFLADDPDGGVRAGGVRVPAAVVAAADGGSLRRDQFRGAVFFHRRGAGVPERGAVHDVDVADGGAGGFFFFAAEPVRAGEEGDFVVVCHERCGGDGDAGGGRGDDRIVGE